jgi:hypothetical protein
MEFPNIDPLLIPILGILMPLVLVPMILILKHRFHRREWEHKERMKTMELQLPTPPGHLSGKGTAIAFIGGGVPIASVVTAFLAGVTLGDDVLPQDSIAIHGIAWGCAVLISLAAMATSLIMAFIFRKSANETATAAHEMNGKLAMDPDAYDVVSTRA